MTGAYDGIIIGSGHNSLVLQAYLCRAGLDVVCLETRTRPGGGLTTMEDPRQPGFLHNTHSFFHRAITSKPWYQDLNLSEHGASYLEPDLNAALITDDGEPLEWWTDFDKTIASFERFSSEDAAALDHWRDEFRPIVEEITVPESQAPPLPPDRRRELLEQSPEGRRLLEVSSLSPIEFVRKHFEHPVIQAGLLFFNGLREVDLRVEGFGHHIPMLLATPEKAQLVEGGSAQLARALVSVVEHHGGDVALGVTPERITVADGAVTGVETTDGETYRAREFVASGLNPQQTFLDLLPKSRVSGELREQAADYEYNTIAPLFGVYLDLDAAPQYEATETHPELADAFMVIQGLNEVDDYIQMVDAHEDGTVPPTIMWGCTPTKFDPSQAPEGKHTAFMWEKMPYDIQGDAQTWDTYREEHGRAMIERWTENAPNLEDAIIDSFVRSPLDTERTFPNMRNGDLLVGSFANGQIGYHRPFPGAGHYRAPEIDGLYLSGSCCHPGGNITGLVGYNCAQVVSADLDLMAPWAPEPIESQLQSLT